MPELSVDDAQSRIVAFVRAFGLHRPEQTPYGAPIPVSEAHALTALDGHAPWPRPTSRTASSSPSRR